MTRSNRRVANSKKAGRGGKENQGSSYRDSF